MRNGADIIKESSNTITIGASSDTVALLHQVHHKQVLVEQGLLIGETWSSIKTEILMQQWRRLFC
ncbi:MAG: hypothetical protein CM15mV55_830 [uncultured marine virus]|nr:MAG: hypothetical protein CM15mV55_830 [uncultured marine virus]